MELPLQEGARILTGCSALLLVTASLMNIFVPHCYCVFVTAVETLALGCVALLCEFSPLALSKLVRKLPWLEEQRAKGCLYVATGILAVGKEFGVVSQIAGFTLMAAGVGHIALHYLFPSPAFVASGGYEEASQLPGYAVAQSGYVANEDAERNGNYGRF